MAEKQTRYRKGEFITVPNRSALKGQKPYVQSVFMWLCRHADEEGVCWPTYKTLAEEAGTAISSAKAAVKWLEKEGLLSRKNRRNPDNPKTYTSNYYQINEVIPKGGGHTTDQGVVIPRTRGGHTADQGSPRYSPKGEPVKRKPVEGEVANGTFATSAVDVLVELVAQYHRAARATYNPSNKTERAAAERILELRGIDGAKFLAEKAFSLIGVPYAPQAPTLFEMDKKAIKIMDAPPSPNGFVKV